MGEGAKIVKGIVREIVHTIPHTISLTVSLFKGMSFISFYILFDDLGSGNSAGNSVGNSVHYFPDYFYHAVTFSADWIYSGTMGAWAVRTLEVVVANILEHYNCKPFWKTLSADIL